MTDGQAQEQFFFAWGSNSVRFLSFTYFFSKIPHGNEII